MELLRYSQNFEGANTALLRLSMRAGLSEVNHQAHSNRDQQRRERVSD